MARADDTDLIDSFEEFYKSYYRNEIEELAQKYPNEQKSLYIDWEDLYRYDPDLAYDYRNKPTQLREYAEEALRLYDLPVDISLGKAHVRVEGLPEPTPISDIRGDHRGMLLAVPGTVEKTTEVQPKITTAAFECQRCGTLTRIPQEGESFQEPHECQGCERQGPFRINYDQSEFIDAQKLSLKEPQTGFRDGDAETIEVNLEDDITGIVSIGDKVVVTGILKLDQEGSTRKKSPRFGKYLNGQTLEIVKSHTLAEITDDDTEEILELSNDPNLFDRLEQSIAPTVYGWSKEKRALALQLFGGVSKEYEDGTSIRGNIHTLFVSDPGTFIQRVLESALEYSPHAVEVDGSETSATGLTTTGVRSKSSSNDDGWEIGAGPLIEADQGHALINGIHELNSEAESSLETVLKRQSVDASKATASKTFDARTSVMAIGNPKYGRFDQYEPIGEQLTVRPDLISSFDLVFTLTDNPEPDIDAELADQTLTTAYSGEVKAQHEAVSASSDYTEEQVEEVTGKVTPEIDPELLRRYVTYARENCFPTLTEEARDEIQEFYVELRSRGSDEDLPVAVSAKKLEALVRLAEASARARLSDTVTTDDVARAIELVSYSLEEIGIAPKTGEFDSDVIEAGATQEQRSQIKNIESILLTLDDGHYEGVPIQRVLDMAEKEGIARSKAKHEIKKLKQKGEVYEPKTDHLRSVKSSVSSTSSGTNVTATREFSDEEVEQMNNMKRIIATIEDEYDEGAPIDVIFDRAVKNGMEHEIASDVIENLKQLGEVYEPRTDHLRTT